MSVAKQTGSGPTRSSCGSRAAWKAALASLTWIASNFSTESSQLEGVTCMYGLHSMQEGSKHLQSSWHALHVDRTREDRKICGAAIGNIRSRETFLIEVRIQPIPT